MRPSPSEADDTRAIPWLFPAEASVLHLHSGSNQQVTQVSAATIASTASPLRARGGGGGRVPGDGRQIPPIKEIFMAITHDEASVAGQGCDDQFQFALDLVLDGLERMRSAMLLELDTCTLESAHAVRVCVHVRLISSSESARPTNIFTSSIPPSRKSPLSSIDLWVSSGLPRRPNLREARESASITTSSGTVPEAITFPIHENLDQVPASAGRQVNPRPHMPSYGRQIDGSRRGRRAHGERRHMAGVDCESFLLRRPRGDATRTLTLGPGIPASPTYEVETVAP